MNDCKTTLARFQQKIADASRYTAKPSVLIAALGDSVTEGAGAEGENLGDDVYHAQLQRLLETQYPQCEFRVVNAGVGGQVATDLCALPGVKSAELNELKGGVAFITVEIAADKAKKLALWLETNDDLAHDGLTVEDSSSNKIAATAKPKSVH